MGLDTYVRLGDVTFAGMEVPEEIPFGGEQRLVVHRLVGGGRVVDSLGRDDDAIEWRGLFFGQGALDRAKKLDQMRVAGTQLSLTWSTFNKLVVIQRFKCSFQRFYKLPYEISCLVVQDRIQPIAVPPTGVDAQMQGDMKSVSSLAAQVGNPALTSAVASLNSTITSISAFATQAKSTIAGVLAQVNAVRKQVQVLVAQTNNVIQQVTTVGGLLPGNQASKASAKLANQVVNMNNLPILRNMDGTLGRMGSNLSSLGNGTTSTSVTTAGGNLFSLAQRSYGDATKWNVIAKANNQNDPVLTGVNTLTIPSDEGFPSGGVNGV